MTDQPAQTVNTLLVQTYWHIGQHIVEFEQGGKEKAEYGSDLLYLSFQNSETLSHKLTWSRDDDQEAGDGRAP